MAAEIKVVLDPKFAADLSAFATFLRRWDSDVLSKVERAMRVIATRWESEAKKRVPSDTSNLRQRILTEVFLEAGVWIAACGTNVPYGKWLEFGTRYIAGGRVQAIGESPDVTDAQAVTNWPALSKDGGIGEQMPWLRPSLNAIKDWAVQQIIEAVKPPER